MQRSFTRVLPAIFLFLGACVAAPTSPAPEPASAATHGKADGLEWVESEELRAQALAIAAAGTPILIEGSTECPGRYDDERLVTKLGSGTDYGTYECVAEVDLPGDVAAELARMADAQLENESDYDQRVTKLHVFENDSFSAHSVSLGDIERLLPALQIPEDQYTGVRFTSFEKGEEGFGYFEGLYVGEEYVNETALLKYLRTLTADQKVLVVSFGTGVELYPGGGISGTYYLFVTDDHLIYLKQVGWDA
jgi:hypothetical protein